VHEADQGNLGGLFAFLVFSLGAVRHGGAAGTLPARILRFGRYRCVALAPPGLRSSASTRRTTVPHRTRHDRGVRAPVLGGGRDRGVAGGAARRDVPGRVVV